MNRARAARRRGIATLWFVMMVMAFVAFVAIAVDVLYVVVAARQLSAGADSASLAGALEVRRSHALARQRAVSFAAANDAAKAAIQLRSNDSNNPDGDVVLGHFFRNTQTFVPMQSTAASTNAVRVRARRTAGSLGGQLGLLVGPIFGVNTANVERYATAIVGGDLGIGVIALHPTDPCSLKIQGNSELIVRNGVVIVDSNDPSDAACAVGNAGHLEADELLIVGGVADDFADRTDFENEIYTGVDYVPDPLAALPEPNPPVVHRSVPHGGGPPNQSITLQPGYYSSMVFGPRTYVMQSGLYYVDGPVTIHGDTRVDGTAGVMIFVGPNGSVNMMGQGNGWLRMNAMDPMQYPNGPAIPAELTHARVSLFQARSNGSTLTFRGNNNWQVTGTLYAAGAKMSVGGTPDTFSNGLIADKIEVFGNGSIVVDVQPNAPIAPRFVFLVE